jgi:hypothetical protein
MWVKTNPSTQFSKVDNIFVKVTGENIWKKVTRMWAKVAASGTNAWREIFYNADLPQPTSDVISIRLGSYNGTVATSPQYINTTLYGHDGEYTNWTIKSGRKWTYATTALGERIDLETSTSSYGDDILNVQSNQEMADEMYVFYEMKVENNSDFIKPTSDPVYMIKRQMVNTQFDFTGNGTSVGNTLQGRFAFENYWYNKPDQMLSVVRWWRSPSAGTPGGVLLKEDLFFDAATTNNSTTISGSYPYTITSADIGSYIVFEVLPTNSYSRYYNENTSQGISEGAPVSGAVVITSEIQDVNYESGLDNNILSRVPTNTFLRTYARIENVNSLTTYRVRYRVYNWQTGIYWNPGTVTATDAAGTGAWLTYTANASGSGNISTVTIANGVATIYDTFSLDATFNGSTYSGGSPRWNLEIEVSAIKSGQTTTYYHDYDISAAPTISLSATPANVGLNSNTTITVNLGGSPSPNVAYPRQFIVYYGDGTDSGWQNIAAGSGTPITRTLTKSYSTTGTKNLVAYTRPRNGSGSVSVGVNSFTAPTPSQVVWNGTSFVITYSGGSGPWFQSWYNTNGNYPTDGTGFDNGSATQSTTTITYTPGFTPTPNTTYYFWVRSALTATANTIGSDVSSYSTTRVEVFIPPVATAPTSVSAANNGSSTTITASWSGATNAGRYRIYWNTSGTTPGSAATTFDEEKLVNGTSITSTAGSWAWGPGDPDKNGSQPASGSTYFFFVSSSYDGNTWSGWTRSPSAVGVVIPTPQQTSAPFARATSNNSTTTVKYLDSITWGGGTYTNASSVTSVLIYSTNTANLQSPGGNTNSLTRTSNPYVLANTDPVGTPYVFAVRDTVVGTNGTTYYFYSNQITSALADGVAFTYGTSTSAAGGWTASINSGAQTGATYSFVSATAGSATVNSTSGAVTATGLGSGASSTVTVSKALSGYQTVQATPSGIALTVTTYTLTYSANGGSTTPTSQTGTAGQTITLASGAGTRSGFTFGGWDIGGVTYSGGGSYTFGSANATATAIWNAVFVTPQWNGTMPGWTAGSNFQRITTGTANYKWGWTNGTFSFSGSVSTSRGWNFNGPNSTQLAAGTARTTSTFRSFTTTNDTYTSVQGVFRPYLVSSLRGDVTYSTAARYGSIQPYQFGTDGNEYTGPWTAGI